jgi:hypothetical protein
MRRELRKVPANWEHPKTSEGKYQPMFNEYYGDVLKEWIDDHNKWEDGTHPDLVSGRTTKEQHPFFAMWNGGPPDAEYYQVRKFLDDELTHIQLYQTTSEGTPISPVFHADELENLCEWAAENATTFASFKASKEEWLKMLSNDFVFHQEGGAIFL